MNLKGIKRKTRLERHLVAKNENLLTKLGERTVPVIFGPQGVQVLDHPRVGQQQPSGRAGRPVEGQEPLLCARAPNQKVLKGKATQNDLNFPNPGREPGKSRFLPGSYRENRQGARI